MISARETINPRDLGDQRRANTPFWTSWGVLWNRLIQHPALNSTVTSNPPPSVVSTCPACNQRISAASSYVGVEVSCPTCTGTFVFGSDGQPPAAEPPMLDREAIGDSEFAPGDDQFAKAIKGTLKDFKHLDYGFLFPLRKLFSRDLIGSKALRLIAVFGLAPLAILIVVEKWELEFRQSVWLVSAYFCYFWAVYLRNLVKPGPKLGKSGTGYLFFTLFIGIPLLVAWHKAPIVSSLMESTSSDRFTARVFGFVAGVGIFEESCKALPLLLFAFRKGPFPIRDGIFLGVMSGLGFALAEVVQYSVGFWENSAAISAFAVAQAASHSTHWNGSINPSEFGNQLELLLPNLSEYLGSTMLGQVVRFIPLPLLHAAWAGVAGWFIAVASQRTSKRIPVIVVGIGFVAVIHGLYDVFAAGYIGLALAAFSIVAFLCYLLHGEETATVHDPETPAP